MDLVMAEQLISEHFEGRPSGFAECEEVLVEEVLMPSLGGDQSSGRAALAELVSRCTLDLRGSERSSVSNVGAWGWPPVEEQPHFTLVDDAETLDNLPSST
jgi:hypothetical protein